MIIERGVDYLATVTFSSPTRLTDHCTEPIGIQHQFLWRKKGVQHSALDYLNFCWFLLPAFPSVAFRAMTIFRLPLSDSKGRRMSLGTKVSCLVWWEKWKGKFSEQLLCHNNNINFPAPPPVNGTMQRAQNVSSLLNWRENEFVTVVFRGCKVARRTTFAVAGGANWNRVLWPREKEGGREREW